MIELIIKVEGSKLISEMKDKDMKVSEAALLHYEISRICSDLVKLDFETVEIRDNLKNNEEE